MEKYDVQNGEFYAIDDDGYRLDINGNYGDMDETFSKFIDGKEDVIFIGITSPNGDQQCVALNLEQVKAMARYCRAVVDTFEEERERVDEKLCRLQEQGLL
jgi:hypothetical protein